MERAQHGRAGRRLTLAALSLIAMACGSSEPNLAPTLLDDAEEMTVYLDAFPVDDYQIAKVPGIGRFYIDDNPAAVKRTLLEGKPGEPAIQRQLRKHAKPGATVLDVGAHIGSLTVPLSRMVGPTGHVFAIEPQRKIYRELVRNLELNQLTNVTPLRFALSDEPGIVEMGTEEIHDGRRGIGSGGDRVEARTIDSFGFTALDVIKIDVEGHERPVLDGAAETIRRHHPVIFIEVWPENRENVLPLLREYGYSIDNITWMDYVATWSP